MDFSRRLFCGMGLSGLLWPRLSWGRPAQPGDRKFLFIYLWGGADQTTVLAPTMSHSSIEDEPGATLSTGGGLEYVDHIDRPSVRSFFEGYGDQSAILHGFEVRSVAHERCQQLVLTGSADTASDDWPTLLAAHGPTDLLLPCLVHSGPSYSSAYADRVIRAGETGQLSQLLDGTALTLRSDDPVVPPSADTSAAVDAYLREQISASNPTEGRATAMAAAYDGALARLSDVKQLSGTIDLTSTTAKALPERIGGVIDCLEMGLSRSAIVEYRGVNEQGFDTHTNNSRQSMHHEELFGYLTEILDDMASRSGQGGGSLLDETVVVVFSEMGRHPVLNFNMGKDHWTYISVLLAGGGIRGGLSIGGYNDDFRGARTNLETGEVHSSGTALLPSHLGATLLALGGIDPGPVLPGFDPITALL